VLAAVDISDQLGADSDDAFDVNASDEPRLAVNVAIVRLMCAFLPTTHLVRTCLRITCVVC
jgi:hypothetical protein